MIRTDIVALTVIPGAAYRQKLPSGGSGVVLLRRGSAQPGIASISKTSGDPIPSANTPAAQYPVEAFKEAIALTAGMPGWNASWLIGRRRRRAESAVHISCQKTSRKVHLKISTLLLTMLKFVL